ncbi:DUF2971 domain-containing protein [Clostridium sp.]|uniref:DUF2971 domain-containing protein n=1 Tax=Clostridium sp. TaxID=1506 RepID=UPI00262BBB1F|nr:DUF2971 domain-containing protein [Clostridium sp.]
MSFEIKTYISMIRENKDYDSYRMKYIPKKLYKYIYLSDVPSCKNKCSIDYLNDLKLNSLKNNEFWLSFCKNLNDPFELKTLFITEDKIKKYNYPIKLVKDLRDSYYNGFLIGCFTQNLTNNMPMWAHYANNHTGFCIEYMIEDPKFFYPISYEKTRSVANVTYMNCIALICKEMTGTITEKEKEDLVLYNTLLFHNCVVKNDAWKYENEYRLLFPTESAKLVTNVNDEGGLIPNEVLGIKITGIYLGIACEKYKDRLIEIGKELEINTYQMYFDDNSENYQLSYKKIE